MLEKKRSTNFNFKFNKCDRTKINLEYHNLYSNNVSITNLYKVAEI